MPTLQTSFSYQGGGSVLQGGFNIEAEHPNPFEVPVPAAVAGVLSTRTDANTGQLTVATGHGVTTDDTVDLYTAAGVLIRRDMDVTAVGGTTINIDLGSGDDLPSAATAVVVCKQTLFTCLIDGDDIEFIVIGLDLPGVNKPFGRAIFEKADDSDVFEAIFAGRPLSWDVAGGQANDFEAAAVAKCRVSHAHAIAGKFKIISMEDPT